MAVKHSIKRRDTGFTISDFLGHLNQPLLKGGSLRADSFVSNESEGDMRVACRCKRDVVKPDSSLCLDTRNLPLESDLIHSRTSSDFNPLEAIGCRPERPNARQ